MFNPVHHKSDLSSCAGAKQDIFRTAGCGTLATVLLSGECSFVWATRMCKSWMLQQLCIAIEGPLL